MAKPILTDELWEVIEPLLPPEPAKPKGGRPRIPNRAVLTGIIFVLKTGMPWEMLPPERQRWVVEVVSPAGADCEIGNKQVSGNDCTRSCSIAR